MTTSTKKYALVTGASSGIGFYTAKELASRGITVFACARRLEPMEPLKELGITILRCDVTSPDDVKQLKDTISHTTNKLDILYNNAGASCTFPAIDVPDSAAAQAFEVNVLAPIRVTREFSKLVINAKGIIVFTGSIAGICPFPFASVYAATKAAIHQYAQVLHLEMKLFDVKVLNLITGGVLTNIADTRPLPEGSLFDIPEGQESMVARRRMAAENHPQDPKVYAKNVVNDILKASPYVIDVYRGSGATIVPTIVNWVPRLIWEYGVYFKFKLFPVWRRLREIASKKTA